MTAAGSVSAGSPASTGKEPSPPAPPHRQRRNIIWYTCQLLLQVVFTFWLRYRCRGIENLPADGPALLLINHQSFLDPLLVGLPLDRPVSFLARDSLFRIPVVGTILRLTYVVPIDRSAASTRSIRTLTSRLDAGWMTGIFPEGTRSEDGQVGPLKPGFVAIVRRTGAPLIPVGIAGANRAMPRSSRGIRRETVRVVIGEALPDELKTEYCRKGREREFAELVRQRIVACQLEAEQWCQDGNPAVS
ncbi:MAG: 1-acyl-sn-glycerol-3-phosphate acyltransferase [Planctomycetaceae bacterium]|nr:1-acyl-sn-glycerol-3-phosphate acyltransferase [Planctomycetaceae bacterium]